MCIHMHLGILWSRRNITNPSFFHFKTEELWNVYIFLPLSTALGLNSFTNKWDERSNINPWWLSLRPLFTVIKSKWNLFPIYSSFTKNKFQTIWLTPILLKKRLQQKCEIIINAISEFSRLITLCCINLGTLKILISTTFSLFFSLSFIEYEDSSSLLCFSVFDMIFISAI